MRHPARLAPLLPAVLAITFAGTLAGCSIFQPDVGGSVEVTNIERTKSMAPTFATAAYRTIDENTADIYLSDLPQDRLSDPRDPLTDVKGSFFHVRIFLVPSPGSTPIDATACNVTVRHLVLAGPARTLRAATDAPALGLYAGGGFLMPDADIGDATFGGRLEQVSHRLVREGPGFTDLLGPGLLTGRFAAARNDAVARALAARFDQLVNLLPPSTDDAIDVGESK